MKSIAFIIPDYGTSPTWFQLWLVFTDISTDCYSIPSNVKFEHVTFPELGQKIQHKYDFPIRLEFPYKLCDFKPAYGEIIRILKKTGVFQWSHGTLEYAYLYKDGVQKKKSSCMYIFKKG